MPKGDFLDRIGMGRGGRRGNFKSSHRSLWGGFFIGLYFFCSSFFLLVVACLFSGSRERERGGRGRLTPPTPSERRPSPLHHSFSISLSPPPTPPPFSNVPSSLLLPIPFSSVVATIPVGTEHLEAEERERQCRGSEGVWWERVGGGRKKTGGGEVSWQCCFWEGGGGGGGKEERGYQK